MEKINVVAAEDIFKEATLLDLQKYSDTFQLKIPRGSSYEAFYTGVCDHYDNQFNLNEDCVVSEFLDFLKNEDPFTLAEYEKSAKRAEKAAKLICICQGVAKNLQIIRCSNPKCSIIEYHMECLGLDKTFTSSSSWICPNCTEHQNNDLEKNQVEIIDEPIPIPTEEEGDNRNEEEAENETII